MMPMTLHAMVGHEKAGEEGKWSRVLRKFVAVEKSRQLMMCVGHGVHFELLVQLKVRIWIWTEWLE